MGRKEYRARVEKLAIAVESDNAVELGVAVVCRPGIDLYWPATATRAGGEGNQGVIGQIRANLLPVHGETLRGAAHIRLEGRQGGVGNHQGASRRLALHIGGGQRKSASNVAAHSTGLEAIKGSLEAIGTGGASAIEQMGLRTGDDQRERIAPTEFGDASAGASAGDIESAAGTQSASRGSHARRGINNNRQMLLAPEQGGKPLWASKGRSQQGCGQQMQQQQQGNRQTTATLGLLAARHQLPEQQRRNHVPPSPLTHQVKQNDQRKCDQGQQAQGRQERHQ